MQVAGLPEADRLYQAGRFEEAQHAYESLLAQRPDDPGLLLRLGVTHYERRQYPHAEALLRRAVEAVPEMQPGLVALGTTLLMLDRPAEAVPVLERALKIAPGDAMARRALGHAFALQNDLVKGEALLGQLVEENPDDDEAWLYLGMLFFEHNYSSAALAALDRHLALRPSNTKARIYRAGALSQLGRVAEAERAFEALAGDPNVSASTDYLLGHAQLLFRSQRYAQALSKIERAVEIDAASAKLRFWQARILAHSGRNEEAVGVAEESLRLDPSASGARTLLIRLYGRLGRADKVAELSAWLRSRENQVARGTPR